MLAIHFPKIKLYATISGIGSWRQELENLFCWRPRSVFTMALVDQNFDPYKGGWQEFRHFLEEKRNKKLTYSPPMTGVASQTKLGNEQWTTGNQNKYILSLVYTSIQPPDCSLSVARCQISVARESRFLRPPKWSGGSEEKSKKLCSIWANCARGFQNLCHIPHLAISKIISYAEEMIVI